MNMKKAMKLAALALFLIPRQPMMAAGRGQTATSRTAYLQTIQNKGEVRLETGGTIFIPVELQEDIARLEISASAQLQAKDIDEVLDFALVDEANRNRIEKNRAWKSMPNRRPRGDAKPGFVFSGRGCVLQTGGPRTVSY